MAEELSSVDEEEIQRKGSPWDHGQCIPLSGGPARGSC